MSPARLGVLAMIVACTLWGLAPLYYSELSDVPAMELLAHRTLWSALVFALVLGAQGRLYLARALLTHPARRRETVFAALAIGTNWLLYLIAVQRGWVTESALGYYIFPICAVLLGVVIYRERLALLQWLAVALAAAAVLVLAVGLGSPPWMALALALTFSLYGLAKKRIVAPGAVSVFAEVLVLLPLAVLWIAAAQISGQGAFGQDWTRSALLAGSGILSALPLMLFAEAARRVDLSTLGLLQYLNPTLQALGAVLILGELFGPARAVSFALIWAALALYTVSALRQDRARRRSAMASSAEAAL